MLLSGDAETQGHIFARIFNVESLPNTFQFYEPTGEEENYAALVDKGNDIKDAASAGSISLDSFNENETGVATAFTITTMAEGTGSFTGESISACYCSGLIAALDAME